MTREVDAEAAIAAQVGLGALVQVCAEGRGRELSAPAVAGSGGAPRPVHAPPPALLTHARAPPGAHVQAVAAVAVAVVGAAGVHADAPAGAARLRLALVHV